jgi:hypothetical protein
MTRPFRPSWWLPGGHLQTLWPALLRRPPTVALRRERLELADGDFLDLDWLEGADPAAPLALLLHGLEGGPDSHYVPGMLQALGSAGFRPVVMYHRGCSGEPNRHHRRYTGGDTADVAELAARLRTRHPGVPLAVVGVSLGANVLLKWLGEEGAASPVAAAAAISPPFRLDRAAERLDRGLSRLYQRHLLTTLSRALARKYAADPAACPVPPEELAGMRSFRAFDDAFTAPVHRYAGVDDYYARASARQYLGAITVPTLIVHATDDPFTTPDAVPGPGELSPAVRLELYRHGGHVGFVAGSVPGRPRYWLEERVPAFLRSRIPSDREPASRTPEAHPAP